MTQRMISYEVKEGEAERNEELIRAVFEEARGLGIEDLRYEAYVLDDGVSFVHVVEFPDGENPLAALPAFARYIAEVRERCAEPPAFSELRRIGAVGG